mmetsp:Transcript_16282/g.35432  ORF Transcript_16282/g.35432 Transcript_16282/m.35432 type:complete len:117 (-) Transcript_16282:8-358(-)
MFLPPFRPPPYSWHCSCPHCTLPVTPSPRMPPHVFTTYLYHQLTKTTINWLDDTIVMPKHKKCKRGRKNIKWDKLLGHKCSQCLPEEKVDHGPQRFKGCGTFHREFGIIYDAVDVK